MKPEAASDHFAVIEDKHLPESKGASHVTEASPSLERRVRQHRQYCQISKGTIEREAGQCILLPIGAEAV